MIGKVLKGKWKKWDKESLVHSENSEYYENSKYLDNSEFFENSEYFEISEHSEGSPHLYVRPATAPPVYYQSKARTLREQCSV